MSAATELADLEAAITEAELTDEQAARVRELVGGGATLADAFEQLAAEQAPPEPEPTPEPPPEPPAGEPTDKQLRDLDRENERHAESVRRIMGAFAVGLEPCRECGGLGFGAPGPKPQPHDFFQTCETCAGFGQVLTGSLRAGQEARDCPACMGRGYLEQLDPAGAPLAPQPGTPPAPIVTPAPAQLEPTGNGEQPTTAPRFGVPSWMGDPAIGGS